MKKLMLYVFWVVVFIIFGLVLTGCKPMILNITIQEHKPYSEVGYVSDWWKYYPEYNADTTYRFWYPNSVFYSQLVKPKGGINIDSLLVFDFDTTYYITIKRDSI